MRTRRVFHGEVLTCMMASRGKRAWLVSRKLCRETGCRRGCKEMTEKELSVTVHKAWEKQREHDHGLRLLGSLVLKKEPEYLLSVLISVFSDTRSRIGPTVQLCSH